MRRVKTESRELPIYEGFIYTLEMTPETWHTSAELWQEVQQVVHTVEFADEHPIVDAALQTKKGSIVKETPNKEDDSHQYNTTIQQHSITRDPEDDPIDISRPESGDTWDVEGINISSGQFLQPLKTKEVHIE